MPGNGKMASPVRDGEENRSNLEIEQVRIYNVSGQLLRAEEWKGADLYLEHSGIYYLEIVTDRGVGVKKVVVK